MQILVSGSIAYDRIMDFPGRFSDHIVPEKVHMINVSFTVNGMVEKFGGTAGNIAYALALLGERPRILAAIGLDYARYFQWLDRNGIPRDDLRVVEEEFTSSAFITTDQADNQITGFNPGAMKHQAKADLSGLDPAQAFAIVAPGNIQDMVEFATEYRKRGVPYIFDPGQAIPALSGDDLRVGIAGSRLLIANDYEMEMIMRKTELDVPRLLELTQAVITTRGEHGSVVTRRDGEATVPAVPPRQVLDPTGAGDAYRAGLVKGLIEGRDLVTAAMMGSTVAAYAVETYGTQEYRFTLGEFQARFDEHFARARS